MRFEFSAGSVVFRKDGKNTLFLFLIKDDGTLDIPKGHIEKGENALQAAIREAKEESGIDITPDRFFRRVTKYFFFEGKEKIMKTLTVFLSETNTKEVKVSFEHKGYKWLDFDEAMKELKYKGTKKLLTDANDYIKRIRKMDELNREYSELPRRTAKWMLSKRFVPGEGPLDAKVMLVGQAPGRSEDAQLRPFVGRSGMLLESMLNRIRMKRSSVYITSVVQFFPPENRVPTDEEIEMCKPFLIRQMNIVKPKYVVLLGNVPSKVLLGLGEVRSNHGRFFNVDGVTYMPTLHPAAVLRIRKLEADMEADFRALRDMMSKG
ncbi:MAG: uracil-DNA glycosylase family protein [Candidatus Micrarchaeia archaeon]